MYNVTLPSVDSRVTSVNQPLTPTSSSVLAIITVTFVLMSYSNEIINNENIEHMLQQTCLRIIHERLETKPCHTVFT